MFHTFITRASIDAHASLHASIRPRASRLSARRRRCPPTLGTSRRASASARIRAHARRDRDATETRSIVRASANASERETRRRRETRSSARVGVRPSRAETKRNDDMSAKSGGGKGKSGGGNRTTPFATMSVSPFLWCVGTETEETMRGGDDKGKARSGRERETRERTNE